MPAFRTIGLVVNPLAGMGGRVGLKGTDGLADRARSLGAEPLAPGRAAEALAPLAGQGLQFVTASGEMGAAPLAVAGIVDLDCVYGPADLSTAADTRAACRAFLEAGVDLVLFCGGDGTARDVADAVGTAVPVLGIPAGVKMYSSVFALDPGTVGRVLLADGSACLADAEVIDVDEEAYRANDFRTVLHAIVRTPSSPGLVQAAKQVFEEADEDRARSRHRHRRGRGRRRRRETHGRPRGYRPLSTDRPVRTRSRSQQSPPRRAARRPSRRLP